MNLSFSDRGWKESFYKIVKLLNENKIAGLEISDLNGYKTENAFGKGKLSYSERFLFENGIKISCVNAVKDITDNGFAEEMYSIFDFAKELDCQYVSVRTSADKEVAVKTIEKIFPSLILAAEKAGITVLLETSGVFADTVLAADVLGEFASDNFSALWDIYSTVAIGKESPDFSMKNLGKHVKHVHIKDCAGADSETEFRLLGEGVLPIKDVYETLRTVNYEGFVSLELEKDCLKDLGDLEIVLPQFSGYMSAFEGAQAWHGNLFDNNAKTGKFIWEKETLIDLTFPQVLDRVAEEFPDQLAFKYTTLDYTRTYSEFRDEVNKIARALMAIGVKAGDHVAVWATNVPEWYLTFWATIKIGAVLVTVNTAYKIHELEYLLKQSDTHTLVMIKGYRDSDYQGIVNELCPELKNNKKGEKLRSKRLPFLRNVITVGFEQDGCFTFQEFVELSKYVGKEELAVVANAVSVNDVCNMQYTSGTTGFPKGVMLTHYNVVNNGKCIGDRMDLSTADRMMIQVPMFHCFGMVLAMTASITHGVTICPLPYYSPKPALACINQERITCFHGVPTMFIGMLSHPDFKKTDFSYMRTGIMAGSPCPVAVMQEVLDKMNMKEITIVYGQTEASPGCTMSSTDDSIEVRVNTVGRNLPNIECKIVDPETNEEVPYNTVGEFVARGYNIMKGYYKMPKETAQAIDKDGWLHTGDLALKMPDGNYRITGRLKDMIIRGGENLYPKEIEDFLYTHPKVSDVQVVGVPDEKYGEEAYAYVIIKEGEALSEAELRDYCVKNIAKHKVPRYFDFVDSFPMNAAGKILKYKMREEAAEKIKNKT